MRTSLSVGPESGVQKHPSAHAEGLAGDVKRASEPRRSRALVGCSQADGNAAGAARYCKNVLNRPLTVRKVHSWGGAEDSLKRAREVWLVMEAAFHGDLRKRQLPGLHETDGSLKAKPQHELVRRDADGRAEQTCEMEGTDVRLSSERQQRHIVIKLRCDALQDGAKLKCIQLPAGRRYLRLRDTVIREQVEHKSYGQRLRVHHPVRRISGEFCTERRGEIS